jgi:hypothetical protein
MMVKEERFRSDSKLLRELAEDAYDTCVSAINALHALLREHDESDSEQRAVVATVAGVAEASDHDCGAAHQAPVPVVEVVPSAPVQDKYAEAREWFTKIGYPEAQIARMAQVWQANHISKDAGRAKDLELGSWATLPNKKRIMVFKGHAFEPPTDRFYGVPGPLKHLGIYDRAGGRVVPTDNFPLVPQTREDYPWWCPAADRV